MMKLSLLGSGLLLTALLLNGCGPSAAPDKAGESVFRYGTTAYGVAMENAGMDPHESYKGWSCGKCTPNPSRKTTKYRLQLMLTVVAATQYSSTKSQPIIQATNSPIVAYE